jgi:toxin ParE1/3/4
MKLIIRAAVRADLSQIAAYIARDNPARAVSFAQELTTKIRAISDRPLTFPARDEWGAGLRAALHANYYIIFRVEIDRVIVLRILHAARNIPDFL